MSLKECSCAEFHIMAFPCGHAAAAARKMGTILNAYIDDYYRMFTLREMWGGVVLPLPNPSTWDVPEAVSLIKCLPPDNPKQAGRPRISRRTAGPEGASSSRRKKQVCKQCGSTEHNRGRCKVYMDLLDAEQAEPDEPDHLTDSSVKVRKRAHRKCSICKSMDHLKNKCPYKPPPESQLFDSE
ncbi:hypothetical protein CASFOL_022802 [Castilleja foliolosa]|uniref:SWIM-type domain-containing protein n=1 Tax=Castilleja foliolosa TaxID=1961234 RepID=A0ABD3CTH2_9LAMI